MTRRQTHLILPIDNHDCLLHSSGQGIIPWRLNGPRGPELVTVTGPIIADSLALIHQLAVKGTGIALLPEEIDGADVARGALVRLLPAYAIRGGTFSVVSPPLRHVPARVAPLRDHLIKELPRHLGLPR